MTSTLAAVPALRVRALNTRAPRPQGDYVLYWMIASRRLEWNFALDRALQHARQLELPLLIFEPLRVGYPWASARFHRFVLDGMHEHVAHCARAEVAYFPYVEPAPGAGSGLFEALAQRAAIVVTDDTPAFFLPRMVRAAASRASVACEAVDSNGLLPVRAADEVFATAYAFRRFLQKNLAPHLHHFPAEKPLAQPHAQGLARIDPAILARWPAASPALLDASHADSARELRALPIDHAVAAADHQGERISSRGGAAPARARLEHFLRVLLPRYATERSEPGADVASGLSPWLHFGHLSAHEIFARLARLEGWKTTSITKQTNGRREGWWGLGQAAESFLDELVTWRELGFNFCAQRDDYDRYESLPTWARASLDEHAGDERKTLYTLLEFESARTHDPLWNAAQRQLVREGRMHNYMRMLWGKKVLEWSESPRRALEILIELNNKYALDGRDPNSYSGIFWVFGRYDRPWAPKRPVFGVIRYMTSENTARKFDVEPFLERYGPRADEDARS